MLNMSDMSTQAMSTWLEQMPASASDVAEILLEALATGEYTLLALLRAIATYESLIPEGLSDTTPYYVGCKQALAQYQQQQEQASHE